jgi:hypothetical protein
LRRDGRLTATGSTGTTDSGALTAEVWLAPGRYELVTRDREPVTTHVFTVGEQPVTLCLGLR